MIKIALASLALTLIALFAGCDEDGIPAGTGSTGVPAPPRAHVGPSRELGPTPSAALPTYAAPRLTSVRTR